MTLERLHSLNENSPNVVMTLQGRLANKSSGGACAILGMTLSRADLVFGRLSVVRSVRQRKVTPWLLSNLLKGLILRQEVEDRGERESGSDCSTMNQEHSKDIPPRCVALYPTSQP